MADDAQIRVSADLGGATAGLAALKQAIAGVGEPLGRLKAAFADTGGAIRQTSAATVAAFKADMQRMVAEHAISRQQALGFDIEYTARQNDQERQRLEAALANDAATLAEKSANYAALVQLSEGYQTRLAQDQRRLAEAARIEADRFARPYRQAFDDIGAGWRRAVVGLVEGTLSFREAGLAAARSVERGLIAMAQTTLSRAAAGPLAALLGAPAPALGEGVGDVLGNTLGRWVLGAPTQLGATAASTANTAALAANTAALGALTASLGASSVAAGIGALGVTAETGAAAAGGGGLFDFLGGLFAFAAGGIVPSAARGWALPSFPGARPALLHAREMVLPAPISEGLQRMIADGGGAGGSAGSDMHLHFHGPSDGPAVERWFSGLMARNPGVVRNMLRSNALTPRTL